MIIESKKRNKPGSATLDHAFWNSCWDRTTTFNLTDIQELTKWNVPLEAHMTPPANFQDLNIKYHTLHRITEVNTYVYYSKDKLEA